MNDDLVCLSYIRGVPDVSYRAFVLRIQDPPMQESNARHVECRHFLCEFEPSWTIEANVHIEAVLETRKQLDNGIQLTTARANRGCTAVGHVSRFENSGT